MIAAISRLPHFSGCSLSNVDLVCHNCGQRFRETAKVSALKDNIAKLRVTDLSGEVTFKCPACAAETRVSGAIHKYPDGRLALLLQRGDEPVSTDWWVDG